ncbi:MAG TPA: HpcH/HpaI aldolase/citrate lyase family protein [Jatrophihabitans sp.]|nr:HpcH/HpaI aldolase/citrate lyase family protein [Jatrophihabitans sp.]
MRHFEFLADDDRKRLFLHPPAPFSVADDADLVGVALGATLYCPATRSTLARDVVRCFRAGALTMVICLEDSVADGYVAQAEVNAITQLRDLGASGQPLPMLFVRVRSPEQIPRVIDGLGALDDVLTGFVIPKFAEDPGKAYLEAVVSASARVGRRLLVMPVLETQELAHLESRADMLLAARRLLDLYRQHVPAVRVGATDLSGSYGLRRAREFTVWDLHVVADALSAVVNVFGRVEPAPYVISGPVWEHFSTPERMFKPQLRETPFVKQRDRALRAELLAENLDGLIREVVLDRANGLTGKTVIHPSHVAAVHALSVVTGEDYADATDILATNGRGGATASAYRNKMNESKPHTAWARRIMQRAHAFGVARDGITFVDLLGAGLHA